MYQVGYLLFVGEGISRGKCITIMEEIDPSPIAPSSTRRWAGTVDGRLGLYMYHKTKRFN